MLYNPSTASYQIATQSQAEAGTDNTVLMSPLRSRQLIDKLISPNTLLLIDDFCGGNNTNGSIGELGWTITPKQGPFTCGYSFSQSSFPAGNSGALGALRATTSNILGDGGSFSLQYGSAHQFWPGNSGWDMRWRIQLEQTTNMILRIGFLNDNNPAYNGTPGRGFYFRYSTLASDTNWMAVKTTGSVESVTSMGVAPTTNYVMLRIRRPNGGTTTYFSIDGGTEVGLTSTGGPSTSEACHALIALFTNAASSVAFKIDRFSLIWEGINR